MKRSNKTDIIVIEDNETFSLLITHYLKSNLTECNVYIENSAAEAIQAMKRLQPDILVLDYFMEDQLTARDVLKEFTFLERAPKVILLSSLKDESEVKEMMDLGVDRYVPKSNESMYELVKNIHELIAELPADQEKKWGMTELMKQRWWLIGLAALIILAIAVLIVTQKG